MKYQMVTIGVLLLAACDAQPVVQSPIACQERILAVRQHASLDPAQSRTPSNAFRKLAKRYAELNEEDCSGKQRLQLDQLEAISNQLSNLAANADRVNQGKAQRESRMPDPAVLALASELQGYENRLSALRRELREMQRDKR